MAVRQNNEEHPTFEQALLLIREWQQEWQQDFSRYSEESKRESSDLKKMFAETDRQMKETDRQMKETDRQIKNLMKKMADSESRWAKFIESLVEGNLALILQKKGIDVQRSSQREKSFYNGRQYEIDIVAKNGSQIVAVEVKTTLRPEDVKEFIEELKDFKFAFPEYASKAVYGAMAYISAEGKSEVYAEKEGLFVIRATGESATIINKLGFKPKQW